MKRSCKGSLGGYVDFARVAKTCDDSEVADGVIPETVVLIGNHVVSCLIRQHAFLANGTL